MWTSKHWIIWSWFFVQRKIKKEKVGTEKQISFRSFKKYLIGEYEKAHSQTMRDILI